MRMRKTYASARMHVRGDMQLSWESSVVSSSSNNNSTCARLVSSSPPESFDNSGSCQLPQRQPTTAAPSSVASPSVQQYSNGPAVILVSEDEVYYVEDVKPPTVLGKTVALVRENPPPAKKDPRTVVRACISKQCRRTILLVLAVSLLIFGGLVIPITCLTILKHDSDDAEKSTQPPRHDRLISCCNISQTRFQFSFIGQGLLLSITGVLIIIRTRTANTDVCSDNQPTNSTTLTVQIHYSQPLLVLVCTMILAVYVVMLFSIGFNVWQIMNITIYCNWSHYSYTVVILTELIVSLSSALSTTTILLENTK